MSKLIDCHFHIHPEHMDLRCAGEDLDRFCATAGFSAVSIACVPLALYPGYDLRQLLVAFLLKILRPDKVYVFGALDYRTAEARAGRADFAVQAHRLWELGADGFKMLEGKPTSRRLVPLPLDAPVYEPFYEFLAAHNLPVLVHVADPPVCWDRVRCPEYFRQAGYYYAEEDLPGYEEFRTEILRVARRHPRLNLILAHFFWASGSVEAAATLFEDHPGIAFDLTPGFEMYLDFARQPDAWRDFFIRYGSRILFGTEGGFSGPLDAGGAKAIQDKIAFMRGFLETAEEVVYSYPGFEFRTTGIHLPRATVEQIYAGNFLARLPRQAPRTVNRTLLLEECRRQVATGRTRADQVCRAEIEMLEQIVAILHSL